jgi:hypothetical protein
MRSRTSLRFSLAAALAAAPCLAGALTFHVEGATEGWSTALAAIGLVQASSSNADVIVVRAGAAPERTPPGNAILILEGASELAASFGFRPTEQRVTVRSVEDSHAPALEIVWEKALDLPVFAIPAGARVFAKERWQGAPLIAGFRRGPGAVLWVAAASGAHGYERFPYLAQALADLGFEPALRSRNLWAFFDAAYRARVDLDYFAPRWRAAGIGALHVAAWHYWEPGAANDESLRRLIDACHRNAIQVYAWFELPHVSERFWQDHPEWREKTGLLQDAQLDWRKLMNLTNRDAFRAVSRGVQDLLGRFDWDGVNLAELYFESLEGAANPARFTPMNADVRAEYKSVAGRDPLDLLSGKDPRGLAQFLAYRAGLARRQQEEWIGELERMRRTKPHLDLVLTHVDDRFDPSMREKLGADAARTLPLLNSHDFTFLIEDPATLWQLGPQRYPEIAARYQPLTAHPEKLGIDINVVERYQDVYPTKQQTGLELFSLIHTAAAVFPRLALYFESSIAAVDLPWVGAAAAHVDRAGRAGSKLTLQSSRETGVEWSGPALVDGRAWPAADGRRVWLTRGSHTVQPAAAAPPLRLLDFNGELKAAAATEKGLEFAYESSARAFARFERRPDHFEIDGVAATPDGAGGVTILPRGQHFVSAW